jgi:large subunit ribosomal protein L4
MKTKLFNKQGKEIGTAELTDRIFNCTVSKALLWENVTALLKNKRKGLACTKNKAEVAGGGKKPYRQKGIGWARHGTIRSPIWKGGGVVFGPKPRDYSVAMPKKKKLKALLCSLSAKAKENKVAVIEELNLESPKTKIFADILKSINLADVKTLVGVEKINNNLRLAGRNISNVFLRRTTDINCLDVLSADYLLITKKGLELLEKRCVTKKS